MAAMNADNDTITLEEQVAQAVAALSKRKLQEAVAGAHYGRPAKMPRVEDPSTSSRRPTLGPAPFFHYKDFSQHPDPDPLTPLTPPGRVPNFPAKLHSILSRPDLADIVSWMPHGRSWRILKPHEFEVKVIPTYFEHSKFSSFIRQANGWGFRRITQGRDRNSYYHQEFLRGLPHLCKNMRRPGVSEKVATDVDHEPDFYAISEMYPVPEKAEDDSIMLQCTLEGGPKARMPIYSGSSIMTSSGLVLDAPKAVAAPTVNEGSVSLELSTLTPFQRSVVVSDRSSGTTTPIATTPILTPQSVAAPPQQVPPHFVLPKASLGSSGNTSPIPVTGVDSRMACLAAADKLNLAMPPEHHQQQQQQQATVSVQPRVQQTGAASAEFAAGFAAAAAAFGNGQLRLVATVPQQQQSFQGQQQLLEWPLQLSPSPSPPPEQA